MAVNLPLRGPNESAERYLDRLMPVLRNALNAAPSTQQIYDQYGRVIVSPSGNYSYVGDRLVVAPDIVQIDTADLVAGAVELSKTNIPTMVLGNKVVTGDEVVLNLLAGDVEAAEARIDNLKVNNANIANLSVTKLEAGNVGANAIYLGPGSNVELDGIDSKIVVRDGQATPVTRVEIGKLGVGTTDYGLRIKDAAGNTILSSGAAASLNGAFVQNLDASSITAGFLDVARVAVGSIGDMAANYEAAQYDFLANGYGSGDWFNWQTSPDIVGDGSKKFLILAVSAYGLGTPASGLSTMQMRLRNGAGVQVAAANVAVATPTQGAYGTAVLPWIAQPSGTDNYLPDVCWLGDTPSFAVVLNRFVCYLRLAR